MLDGPAGTLPRRSISGGATEDGVGTLDAPCSKPGATVTAAFFGLAGETSPLPLSYAEEADRDDEPSRFVVLGSASLADVQRRRRLSIWP